MVKRRSFYILHVFLLTVSVVSMLLPIACANRGMTSGPQGGPKDTIPPVFQSAVPENKTLHFDSKRIELTFNEYLQMDRVAENVMISPPQLQMPDIKALGKKVIVQFKDSLRDSTTYTIDFGRSICDFREKNPYPGYIYSFSTGDYIDTLEIAGNVYWAETLNPVAGVVVGIHSDLSDEAVSTRQFARASRSDSTGAFAIHNIHPGTYRVYGLYDISKDYVYQPGEAIAFLDSALSPSLALAVDTFRVMVDSTTVDSIVSRTRFVPDDVVLWLFSESKTRQYLHRCTREERHRIQLTFASPLDSMPLLEATWLDSAVVTSSRGYDTISVWLPDSSLIRRDTLTLMVTYPKTDSVYRPVLSTDTLPCLYRASRAKSRVLDRKLELRTNASAKFGINDTLRLSSLYPLDSIHLDGFHFFEKIDSAYHERPFMLDSVSPLVRRVLFESSGDRMFELRIDSGAVSDIYGVVCHEQKIQLRIRPAEDYASLTVFLKDFDPQAVLQLLDEKENIVRSLPALSEGTRFDFVEPQTYYLRLFLDLNGDGRWTSGDWQEKRHPEPIYYFPSSLNVRANWEFEETFDHLALPPLESKPSTLRQIMDITKLTKKK